MTAADYQAAGLYDPSSPDAAGRLALLEWFASQGATLEEMATANREGWLLYLLSSGRMRRGRMITTGELAAHLGVDFDVVERFRTWFGLPPVAPGEPLVTEEEAVLFQAVGLGVQIFGAAADRFMRVLGGAATRIAEAMVEANQANVRRMLLAGSGELAVAKAQAEAIVRAGAPVEVLQALVPIHLDLAIRRQRNRRGSVMEETTEGCVGFVDLAGSTSLSQCLAPGELGHMVDRFEEVAHEVAVNRGGRIVKFIGDEVMFVTPDANSGCDIALALIEAFAADPSMNPRGGLAMGRMLDRGGDCYGPIVNLAARLAEEAVPGEVLIPKETCPVVQDAGLRCEPAGRRQLRGFAEPVPLVSVSRA